MWLLACQLAGEIVVRLTGLPVPGPVLGMLFLFVLLVWRRPPEGARVLRASDALLRHLQLFFLPAAVGVLAYAGALRADLLPISVAMLGSWLLGLAVVGWLVVLLTPRRAREDPS